MSGASEAWLCPQHRALIRQDADAALALWQQLEWRASAGELATPTLQRARWHVALELIEALQQLQRAEAAACLLTASRALVVATVADTDLLLRLHELLTAAVERRRSAGAIELAGWLTLLEFRLCAPAGDLAQLVWPASASQ